MLVVGPIAAPEAEGNVVKTVVRINRSTEYMKCIFIPISRHEPVSPFLVDFYWCMWVFPNLRYLANPACGNVRFQHLCQFWPLGNLPSWLSSENTEVTYFWSAFSWTWPTPGHEHLLRWFLLVHIDPRLIFGVSPICTISPIAPTASFSACVIFDL